MSNPSGPVPKAITAQVISAVLTLAVTLVAIFGYNVLVVQPQLEQLAMLATSRP